MCTCSCVRGIKQSVASRAGCRSARRHGVPSKYVAWTVRCMKGECADCVLPLVTHVLCVPPSCLAKHGVCTVFLLNRQSQLGHTRCRVGGRPLPPCARATERVHTRYDTCRHSLFLTHALLTTVYTLRFVPPSSSFPSPLHVPIVVQGAALGMSGGVSFSRPSPLPHTFPRTWRDWRMTL